MGRTAVLSLIVVLLTPPAFGAGYSLLNAGIDYFNQGRYSDAITWLDKAIASGDLVPDQMHVAYLDRGLAHARQRELASAISDYTAALALRPNDQFAMRERARAYLSIGQDEKAIPDLAAAKSKKSDSFRSQFAIGLAAWRLGQYIEAGSVFSQLTRQVSSAWFWMQLSNVKSGTPLAQLDDKQINPQIWPNPIKLYYAGKMDEQSVLKAAQENTFAPAGNVCEANFYMGQWRLAHGDMSAGIPLLERAARICSNGSTEKFMTQIEMRKLAEVKQ